MPEGEYVQASTGLRCVNPDFLSLHAIRIGDVGWGFDAVGALSFCMVVEREGRLVWAVDFVMGVGGLEEGQGGDETVGTGLGRDGGRGSAERRDGGGENLGLESTLATAGGGNDGAK